MNRMEELEECECYVSGIIERRKALKKPDYNHEYDSVNERVF